MAAYKQHQSTAMTGLAFVLAALVLSGCGKPAEERYGGPAAEAAAADASAPAGAPDIAVTSAPGVAFTYRYDFRVPDARISAVQERHAAACEALGINRCRITGLQYTLVDEDEVNATLQFKLDPAIARQFGKEAITSVEAAEGILVNSEISGTDVGTGISDSQDRSRSLSAELTRIETRLAQGGIGDRERQELQQQAASLRQQIEGERQSRRGGEAMLASTPMELHYRGGSDIPGLDNGRPISNAFKAAVSSFVTMVGFLLLIIGVTLPWLAVVLGLILLWRSRVGLGVRRWWRNAPRPGDAPAQPPAC